MYIPKEFINYAFSPIRIILFFLMGIVLNIIIVINIGILTSVLTKGVEDTLTNRLEVIKNNNYNRTSTYCELLMCSYLVLDNKGKEIILHRTNREDNKFVIVDKVISINIPIILGKYRDIWIVDKDAKIKYKANMDNYMHLISKLSIYVYIFINAVYFILFTVANIFIYKTTVFKNRLTNIYTENKISSNITEMLHHELSVPTQAVLSLSKSLIAFIEENNLPKEHKEYLSNISNNYELLAERLIAIITLLSNNKHIRRDKNNRPIKDLIDNSISTINSFKVNHYIIEYPDIKSINIIGTTKAKILSNGDIINIFNILFTNSIEVKASKTTITAEIEDNYLILIVKDNGPGIKDINGNFINKPEVIFRSGFSTKDPNSYNNNNNNNNNIIKRILIKLGFNVIDTNTSRGLGLAIVKDIMERYKGSIELYSTDSSGTAFKLKILIN